MKAIYGDISGLLSVVLGLALIAASCGGGGGSSAPGTSGEVAVSLTDAATDTYQAVYVTIESVEVHMPDDTWDVILNPHRTFNLLELVNTDFRRAITVTEI